MDEQSEIKQKTKSFRRLKSDFDSRAEWASTTVCVSDESLDEEDGEDNICGDQTVKKESNAKIDGSQSLRDGENEEQRSPNEDTKDEVLKESEREKQIKRILQAAQKNEVDTVREMLEKDPTLVNATDCDLYTPLHRACYSNHVEVIKVLLSYSANISAKTCDGREPLHCACQWDCVEAASLLLQNGANVNALTTGKLSPLHLASANSKARRTLELLLWHPYINNTLRSEANDLAYDTAHRSSPFSTLFEILEVSLNIY